MMNQVLLPKFRECSACIRGQFYETGQRLANIIFAGRAMFNLLRQTTPADFTGVAMKKLRAGGLTPVTVDLTGLNITLIHL